MERTRLPLKIISGAQTGVDEIGGFAPKGFRTEAGNKPELAELYGIKEHPAYSYEPRTTANICNSTGTVIFGDINSAGSKLTIKLCKQYQKPYICNPTEIQLRKWIDTNHIIILNVAGNRASKLTEKQMYEIKLILREALIGDESTTEIISRSSQTN